MSRMLVVWERALTDVPVPEVFSTGRIARGLKVSPRTVARWIDEGHLKGYRLPCTLDRRVTATALVNFLESHGMPIPAWLSPHLTHLAFGFLDSDPLPSGFQVPVGAVPLGWAIAAAERVGSLLLGDAEGLTVALSASAQCRVCHPTSRVVLVVSEDVSLDREYPGVDLVYRRPVDWAALVRVVAFPEPARAAR